VLVFLSGEREIRDTADALTGLGAEGTEIVPAVRPAVAAEQHRVFAPHPGGGSCSPRTSPRPR
jgi:ATP-dependent helicase HrpA